MVGRTHTIWSYTAGCKAPQRGEGDNSRLKVGSKKAKLRRYTLFQLREWFLAQVELQEEQSLVSIVKLIRENRKWSDFVQAMWQHQTNKVWTKVSKSVWRSEQF